MKKLLLTLTIASMAVGSLSALSRHTNWKPSTPASQMEQISRGLVAMPAGSGTGNFVSWRLLGTDDEDATTFDLIREKTVIARNLYNTNYVDKSGTKASTYRVVRKVNGEAIDTSMTVGTWQQAYLSIPLEKPDSAQSPDNTWYTYTPNDCSVGDVDGDGEYEIILKWYPSNARDNANTGYTGITYLDCYKLNGTLLWRINLGQNIRSGSHYTQFMVYDFDRDGRAELMCKTAPGSIDGIGQYVNQAATDDAIRTASNTKSWVTANGRINGGQEYLTVFEGATGRALHTIAYYPNRNGKAELSEAEGTYNWAVGGRTDTGSYGNRGERYLAAVAYLDGPDQPACAVFTRGYYAYAYLWAVSFDGQHLHHKWLHRSYSEGAYYSVVDSNMQTTVHTAPACTWSGGKHPTMFGNGNHNLSIADVDGDGCDEIIWGSAACDHDGRLLYATGFGHGDAIHLGAHIPDRQGLQVFQIHEEGTHYGWDLHDAATGEIIYWQSGAGDNGRGICDNFDPVQRGSLFWSANDHKPRSALTGETYSENSGTYNFRIFWDGDLQSELLDKNTIDKYQNGKSSRLFTIYKSGPASYCNGSKATPCLQADILGDWREEVILWDSSDSAHLVIYSSNIETGYRVPTLMHDHIYRMGIAWQNVGYNQPPHLGYYLPDAMQPRLLNEDIYEIEAQVGDSISVESRVRYAKSAMLQASLTPDGTRKAYGVPDGFERISYNSTTKTIAVKGVPQQEGDYKFILQLTGMGSEKVIDTLMVHAQATPSGITDIPASRGTSCVAIYDASGRQLPPGTRQKGILFIRENTPNGIITRKILK